MKYYKNELGVIYAYAADGSQDEYIEIGLEPYTRATKEDGTFHDAYLEEPDENGVYQPDFMACVEIDRANCVAKISKKRRSVIDGGVTVDGICLQADDAAHGNMNGYISESIINGLVDITWKCGDGTRYVYTVQDFKPVYKAITTFRRDCFVAEDAILTQIETSDDPKSIDIEAGWPSGVLVTI